jgi:hypothetical protein
MGITYKISFSCYHAAGIIGELLVMLICVSKLGNKGRTESRIDTRHTTDYDPNKILKA